jgi:hypothetical protein
LYRQRFIDKRKEILIMDGIIVENFESQIVIGMTVYDANGDKIGTVLQYDRTGGWFQTEKGVFFPRDRYIPFSAIDRIGPSGIYLSTTKDYVEAMYDQPPFVNVDLVAGPAGVAAVPTVSSGYGGGRVVVDSTTISQAIAGLANGLKVYDSNGEKVGRVYQYVAGSDWIVVEKGVFSSDLYIPVTAVEYLDGEGIHLRVTKDVLKDTFVVRPANVSVDVAAGPAGAVAVASGYDGSRIDVDSTTISLAMERIMVRMGQGPKVYDLDGKEIGRVYEFDPASGWIVVEKGMLSPKELFIPVTAVEYLDNDGVHLRVAKDVLKDAFVVKPANVTFVAITA